MNTYERRLAKLEERAAKRREAETPPGTTRYGRPVPYHGQEEAAIKQGWDTYCMLMRRYCWTEEELIEESEWWRAVDERIEEAGLDELGRMCDQVNFLHVHGPDVRYPGPGYWDPGDAELPHPTPEILAQREAEFEARREAKRGGGGVAANGRV